MQKLMGSIGLKVMEGGLAMEVKTRGSTLGPKFMSMIYMHSRER